MASQLAELQLPADITEKCSSSYITDKGHVETNHVNDGSKVEKVTDSEKKCNTTTEEKEVELFDALPPMPTEMPTLTPLEKLLAESTLVQLPENNLDNHTDTANTEIIKIEAENENVKAETGKDDSDHNNNEKGYNVIEKAKITHFTEDDVLASVVQTLFDQLKLFVAHYQSHDMTNETQNKVAQLQEELLTLTRQNQTLEEERDKALSSAAVARTELRRWLRQNGLNEESAALLDKTMHSTVTPSLPTTTTTITSSKTPQVFDNNKDKDNTKSSNVNMDALQVSLPEVAYPNSVSSITANNTNNNKTNRYKDEEMKNINNAQERTEKLKSSTQSTHSADDQLQVMLSPPTEVTPVEPHTIPLSHALYNHPLASLHIDQQTTSPVQLEAIRHYLCALNEQLQFAEMAIGKHKKTTNLASSLHPKQHHHQNDKTNRRKSESNERRLVDYQSDDSSSSSSSSSSDEEVEPATTSANMVHAKDMDLVVTPSPHRYAIQYNLRQEPNSWKHDTKEGHYHNITSKKNSENGKYQRRNMHNNDKIHTHEQEQERQTRSVSSTRMQRERRDARTHSHDNKTTTTDYDNRSRSKSARTDSSRSRSSTAKMHDNIHKKQSETNADQLFDERQKAKAVRHQIEKNRHFPPSHKEEEQYEKEHEYNVHSRTPKRSVESHSHSSTSHANRIIDSNSSKNECNSSIKNKDNKLVSNTNSNNVAYFKLTPSETRRLLEQSHTRSPDGKHQTNTLSMLKEQEQEQQHKPLRKESVNKRSSSKSKHNESYIPDKDHGYHQHAHRHRHNSNTKRQLQQLRFDDYTNSIGPDLFEDSLRHSKLSYY